MGDTWQRYMGLVLDVNVPEGQSLMELVPLAPTSPWLVVYVGPVLCVEMMNRTQMHT